MGEITNELIIVPGHSSFLESVQDVPDDITDDRYWALQDFQKGEPPYYVEHIEQGLRLARSSPSSVLMFSGGRTRRESGQWSEAATYASIAKQKFETDNLKIEKEEYAKDSFENLKFSLDYFHKLFGKYPLRTTVVGWEFKRERFELHAATLGMKDESFSYIGCNNPTDIVAAHQGELKTLVQFKEFPYGNGGDLLKKRQDRNPFYQTAPYKDYSSNRSV